MKLNLEQTFNKQEFVDWVGEFLPDFNLNIQKVDIPNSFKGAVSIETLGESNLGIRVFVIETDNDPAKRRVGWATDSFSVLKNSGSSNALIAYFSKSTSQWRISLLTSSPIWGEEKVILRLSNPKRQSYVLGPKAKVKTPHQFLITKGRVTTLDDLKTRFSLEVVNKEFYKEISKLFTELVGGTIAVNKKKTTFEPLIRLPSIDIGSTVSLEFAVRLIGRIIFCWFLREKRSSSGDSLMPKELVSLESVSKNYDYYHGILEPIFFEVLNKPQKSRNEPFDTGLFSKIPYLNGGLFSPQKDSDFYEKGRNDLQSKFHNTLVIPDEWIKSLFEVLETYNFTIDENTSFDEELSIDPEMLGRIFENLLAEINPETGESARKSTGSYYTPRIIVDYMVDESLCLYLKEKTGIEEKKLRSLISYDLGDDIPLTDEEKDKIIKYLGEVKILDPACGSGAFPIGALQKIVFILQQVDSDGNIWKKQQLSAADFEFRHIIEEKFSNNEINYLRKLAIIRKSIFGVDIQPIATEISRLRCFLTLTVEQKIDDVKENRGIQPLPNLDFKFVTANSLISLPKNDQMTLFEDKAGIDQLRDLRNRFFTATKEERYEIKDEFKEVQKGMLSKMIDLKASGDLTRKLSEWNPFSHEKCEWFDPEWMFGLKEGFDIVIGNPPYGVTFSKEEKLLMRNLYPKVQFKIDSYALFLFASIRFLCHTGNCFFIIPSTFLDNYFLSNLRQELLVNNKINTIIELNDKIFSAAVVHSMIIGFEKIKKEKYFINTLKSKILTGNKLLIPSEFLKIQKNYQFNIRYFEFNSLLLKINQNSLCFKDVIDLRQAIKSGDDKKYIVSDQTGGFKPILRGKDIHKYLTSPPNLYLNYGNQLACPRDEKIFNQPKILIREAGNKITATYDDCNFYIMSSIYVGILKNVNFTLKYVLALLNSNLFQFIMDLEVFKRTEGVFTKAKIYHYDNLPIKFIPKNEQLIWNEIVDEISDRAKKHKDISSINNEINNMVYKLYGLNDEEIEIVEGESKNG